MRSINSAHSALAAGELTSQEANQRWEELCREDAAAAVGSSSMAAPCPRRRGRRPSPPAWRRAARLSFLGPKTLGSGSEEEEEFGGEQDKVEVDGEEDPAYAKAVAKSLLTVDGDNHRQEEEDADPEYLAPLAESRAIAKGKASVVEPELIILRRGNSGGEEKDAVK